jgi:hypothetical protein
MRAFAIWNEGDPMRSDDMAASGGELALDIRSVGSKTARLVIFIVCVIFSLLLTSVTATAHVKWFVNCNVADDPLPAMDVFTGTFFLFFAIFLVLFYLGCKFERTTLGTKISQLLDRVTATLHRRSDDLLRSVAAVSFALLWADGRLILTPELKASSVWLSAIQLLIPIYMFWRATLAAAGAGIIVLYGYGVATYGLFHMLDYPVFIGLGAFFVLSASRNTKLLAFRFDFLRWTAASTLLWPSMEKFVYPGWVAPIAITHPEITLGFDVTTVVTAAGIVESGLALALFWTPLVRRLAALVFILLLTAATLDFGKVDGIGHLVIITVFLVVFAQPEGTRERRRPMLAPLVGGIAIPAVIFLYTGGHALYYGSKSASAAPLMIGAALLALIFACLNGLSRSGRLGLVIGNTINERRDAPLVPHISVEADPSAVAPWHYRESVTAGSSALRSETRHPRALGPRCHEGELGA